jgi:FkbM family methyltransferase
MNLKIKVFIARFGLIEGLKLYYKFRYGKTECLQLSELKHPLYMTPNTIDNSSFQEIFLDEEYSIDYPKFEHEDLFIIDAGANIGFSSVFYANKFPKATIVSIEPDTVNFNQLEKNTGKYEQINLRKGAVWNKNVFIEVVDKGWGTRGYIVEEVKEKSDASMTGFSISSLMSDFKVDRIDILKMDIEGSEQEVFESDYENWLPKTKCIIIEFHDRMREGSSAIVRETIAKYNFSSFENGENVVFINQDFS